MFQAPEAIDCELEVCEREGNVSFGASKCAGKREERTAKPKQRVTSTLTTRENELMTQAKFIDN